MSARSSGRALLTLTCATSLLVGLHTTSAVAAGGTEIVVQTTIQAAVDQADPGDTVVVPAGTYRESVLVTESGITIVGRPGAVLDGQGLDARTGLRVRPPTGAPTGTRLQGFTLQGLRVQSWSFTGVLVSSVDGFRLTGTTYVDNAEYGAYPVRCSSGRVDHNTATGSLDSGIYVGQCDDVVLDHNVATGNSVGFEIENSTRITLEDNIGTGNAVGAAAFVLPGLSIPATEDVVIRRNILSRNDLPNPIDDPDELLSRVPGGVGIAVIGADRVAIERNVIASNPSAGVGVVSLPADLAVLDPRIDPAPDQVSIRRNVIAGNGRAPDAKLAPLPGADVVWDGSGSLCADLLRSSTRYPAEIPTCR